MGKIGEEITQKIKSAVKAKLIELGIEVDNELPDYIMVLVANKKTQPQMEKDLQLFLGSNTVLFTTWLVNVLKKLEEVTVSKKNYKKIDVTNQEGGIIVTKKEDDIERRQALKKVKVKIEPGTNDSEPNEECLIINSTKDPAIEEVAGNVRSSVDKDTNSSDNDDSESQPRNDESPSQDQGSPDRSANVENDSNEEDASQDKSPVRDDDGSADEKESDNVAGDQNDDSEENDDLREDNTVKRTSLVSLVSARPKIMFGIREQLDEVMEKTINGNRRPREDDGNTNDESDDIRDDGRRKSIDNDFYSRKRLNDDRAKRNTRSPDDYDQRKRSPDNRRRTFDDDRRSPYQRRRTSEFSRRSPDTRRRSPLPRRRSPPDRRRSPFDRRRSPVSRRRSPFDRRRSPDSRRRSPEDHRRTYDDRGRRDDKSPDDRGKKKVTDAREILKRKNSRYDDSLPERSSNEDSHKSEKRRKIVSSLVHKPEEPRERSVEPQIPSLVRVTPRPVRKESIQPNKKLLLLAVADAEKSVARPYNKRQERHSPPPSSSRSTSRKRELPKSDERKSTADSHNAASGYVPPEKIFVTLTNNQKYLSNEVPGGKHEKSREVSARKVYDDSDLTFEDELMYEESYFDYDQDDMESDEIYAAEHQDEYVPLPVKKIIEPTKPSLSMLLRSSEAKCIISLESSPERSCDEWEEIGNQPNEEKEQLVNQLVEKAEKPPVENTTEAFTAEQSDDGFEWSRLGPAPVATVKPLAQGSEKNEKYKGEAVNRALERCKFWPSCLSQTCIYYHPSSPCKMFPLCKSGQECLFIHPDCKFGSACLNLKCPFVHKLPDSKVKALEVIAAPVLPVATGKTSTPLIKCVYFPNCKNLSCKFWHPVKNCKFGRTCARSDCYFFHPTQVIPPKELLTWTSKI